MDTLVVRYPTPAHSSKRQHSSPPAIVRIITYPHPEIVIVGHTTAKVLSNVRRAPRHLRTPYTPCPQAALHTAQDYVDEHPLKKPTAIAGFTDPMPVSYQPTPSPLHSPSYYIERDAC